MHGRLRIERGRRLSARFAAWLLRLPRASASAETRLVVTPRAGGEDWVRTFDRRRLTTWQQRSGTSELAERFGLLEFRFRLDPSDRGGLAYVQRDAALRLGPLRLHIPASWAPRVEALERPAGTDRVEIAVRVDLPVIGPLIAYEGFMTTQDGRR